jgi:L-iditol 2-dehydrogenase
MKALVYHITPARWMLCKAAALVSKRAYYGAISGLKLVDHPTPTLPGPSWVRLKTLLGGVCGTDLGMITQRTHPATILRGYASFPAVLGHENVAVIDDLGASVTGWQKGQRVCVEPAIGCIGRGIEPLCSHCAAGRTSLCEAIGKDSLPARAMIGLNATTGGSWAEHFVAHASQLHAVPDEISDAVAVLVDPIASAAHAVLRRPPRPGERILVNGAGIIALGVIGSIRALRHDNDVTVIARHAFQNDLARNMGATHVLMNPRGARSDEQYDVVARHVGGRRIPGRFGNQGLMGGFDLTYDCTGSGRGMADAMKWTRSRGTMVAVGTSGIALLDTTPLWLDELEIVGANGRQIETADGRTVHTYELVFDWLRTGRLDLSALPIRRYALADYRTAFAELLGRARHPFVKAVFDPARA